MSKELTFEDLKIVVAYMKQHAVKPEKIKTQAQVSRFNRQSKVMAKILGIKPHKWKIGDEYYIVRGTDI